MSFSSPIISELNARYNTNNISSLQMKKANLCDLVESLGHYLWSLQNTEHTVPPQAAYNQIVSFGLTRLNFPKLLDTLFGLVQYEQEGFSDCTLMLELGRFRRPSKEEFQKYKPFYVLNQTMELKLEEVFPVEFVRAIRLYVSELLYRFFRTYDVNETREITDKNTTKVIPICNPTNATYRVGGNNRSSNEFVQFMTLLIESAKILSGFEMNLSDVAEPLIFAATTAKKMREEYKAYQKQIQQTQQSDVKPVKSVAQIFKKTEQHFKPAKQPYVNVWDVRKTEQTQSEPTQSEQTQSEPTQSEPTQSEPTQSEQTQSEQTQDEAEFVLVNKQTKQPQRNNGRRFVRSDKK